MVTDFWNFNKCNTRQFEARTTASEISMLLLGMEICWEGTTLSSLCALGAVAGDLLMVFKLHKNCCGRKTKKNNKYKTLWMVLKLMLVKQRQEHTNVRFLERNSKFSRSRCRRCKGTYLLRLNPDISILPTYHPRENQQQNQNHFLRITFLHF